MAEMDIKEVPGRVIEYFTSLPQDKMFAWLAIVIGFFLIILSFIIQ